MIALVRRPGPRLVDGIVTHIERRPVDIDLALRQHDAYVETLADHGYRIVEVEPADEHPDAVFVEDTVVIVDGTAVLTHPGAPERRGEVAGTERALAELGVEIARIEPPGTLDGGDVLQTRDTVFVGRSGRTNDAGIEQLSSLVRRGSRPRDVVPVDLTGALHLKSAVTALPDGTLIGEPSHVSLDRDRILVPPDPEGGHLVVLDEETVLMAASAPKTAEFLRARGLRTRTVDIREFEKLEGCVTCLSVLLDHR